MLEYSFSDSASELYESQHSFADSNGATYCAVPGLSFDNTDEFLPDKENSNFVLSPLYKPSPSTEDFNDSSRFFELEITVRCSNGIVYRPDNKYDLDSEQGQLACQKFLLQLEVLCKVFHPNLSSRYYRDEFSRAYRVLYTEGSLSYLTEILDSAQEQVTHLWVNGEKYVFSNEVLDSGSALHSSCISLQRRLSAAYSQVLLVPVQAEAVTAEVVGALEEFDASWVDFEHLYVLELMLIEADARRHITKSIKILKDFYEGDNENRAKLLRLIGKINSVANVEGNGRDDLGLNILLAAEDILRGGEHGAVGTLSRNTVNVFYSLVELIRSYEGNIESVDPQLKNNPELVQALGLFEGTWEKAKCFLVNKKKCGELLFFSAEMKRLCLEYSGFKEQIESRDAGAFITIPEYLVLLRLEGKDSGLCTRFCPPLDEEGHRLNCRYKTLEQSYQLGKASEGFYRALEESVLGCAMDGDHGDLASCLQLLKNLAMELQRHKPLAWNQFLDVVLVN